MKITFVQISMLLSIFTALLSADSLKSSLTSIMHQKEKSSVVDLGEINLNGRARPVKHFVKKHSSKAVVAIINGKKIIKKDADAYLKQRTNNQIKNFDLLPKVQQKRLIEEMALPMLIADIAEKELTEEEKSAVYTRAWMSKEASKIKINDTQLLEVYNQLKQQSLDQNVTSTFPPFDSIKERLRVQMIEKMIIDNLLKTAKFQLAS